MNNMKVVFLDIDGVLNSAEHRRNMLRQGDYSVIIESAHLELLQKLVATTDASIVLISSWRKYWFKEGSIDEAGQRIEEAFHKLGLVIYDKTPVLRNSSRSQEVEQWLKQHSYVKHFVILDDNDFGWSKSLRSHWVHCPSESGITLGLAKEATDVLNGKLLPSQELHHSTQNVIQRIINYFKIKR